MSVPYDWVVSLDLDAVFNAPMTSIEEWLKQGSSGSGSGRAALRPVPLSQLAGDQCAASHHGGKAEIGSGCIVMGKDLQGAAGVNGGVAFVRRSLRALKLLAAWWSWPDRGADGEFDVRLKWKVDFPMEQAALNGFANQVPHSSHPGPAALSVTYVLSPTDRTGGRLATRAERIVYARGAGERAIHPWPPHHPLHRAVSARASL